MSLLESILELATDIIDEREDKKNAKILDALDKISANYIAQRGIPAREWLKQEIRNSLEREYKNTQPRITHGLNYFQEYLLILEIPKITLDEKSLIQIVNHITNGHLSYVKDLLCAELVHQGHPTFNASRRADGVFLRLLTIVTMAQAAGKEAETGALGEVNTDELSRLAKIVRGNKRRIICPNCYRIIREWDITKINFDFGPLQVQCKQCNNITPTNLTPWDKTSVKHKITVFIGPIIFIIGSIIVIIFFRDQPSCAVTTLIAIPAAVFWAYNSWRQGKESLKVPIW